MSNDSPVASTRARPSLLNKGLWIVGLGLLANAGVTLYTHAAGRAPDLFLDRGAFAQAAPGGGGQLLGARGIYMAPAQLGPNVFGVYLMDVDSQTLCVYRALPDNNRFKLMAARSFKNDRFLEDWNNEIPLPKDVQNMVTNQRQRQNLNAQTNQPTVDQAPPKNENAPDTPNQ